MGDDPATSVVDRHHRAHDVPDLFICDGSSMVTSGRGQPTMTIQALAFRAADHITELAAGRDLTLRFTDLPRRGQAGSHVAVGRPARK